MVVDPGRRGGGRTACGPRARSHSWPPRRADPGSRAARTGGDTTSGNPTADNPTADNPTAGPPGNRRHDAGARTTGAAGTASGCSPCQRDANSGIQAGCVTTGSSAVALGAAQGDHPHRIDGSRSLGRRHIRGVCRSGGDGRTGDL